MATRHDYGGPGQFTNAPPFGGVGGWAEAIAGDLDRLFVEKSKVTHPNVDDTLVQVWDSTRAQWQTVHYDSGWRDVVATGAQTGAISRLRRVGSRVSLQTFSVRSNGGVDGTPIEVGFKPSNPSEGKAYSVNTLAAWGVLYWDAAGKMIPMGGADGYALVWLETSWDTDSPIPTSLPGVISTPAPAAKPSPA
jgi:hypothetical protein